jgi:predicted phosphodiesterase
MRVAVLSDIHGNLPALEAVLAEVEAAEVDAVVCTGDVVGGPFSAEAFDRMVGLPSVRFVRGNADRFVVEGTDEYGHDWEAERRRLGHERVSVVATWPLTFELELDGLGRTLFFHAIPTADEPVFTRITPDEDLATLLGDVAAELLVCGHTHVQFDRRLRGGPRIVNAGSVGMAYEGRQGAFWALLGPDVELRHSGYDVDAAVDSIRALGDPAHEQLVDYLVNPRDPKETTRFFESRRGA